MGMKRILLNSTLSIIMLLVLVSGCSNGNGEVDGTGTIEAREILVSSLTTSTVEQLYVREGEPVRKNDLIALLDHAILDLRLQQALSREKQARSQLELLEEGARSEDIQQAAAQLEQAEQNMELAKKEWERTEILYKEGSITKSRYDTVQTQYETSKSRYEGSLAGFNKIRDFARPQELQSASAGVEQAAAEADIIRRQIEDCTIKAPIDGTISEVFYEVGEIAQPGRPVAALRDLDEVHLTVYLPGPMLAGIKPGDPAAVYVDGVPGRSFPGTVTYIHDEAEFTPKNVQTREQRVKLVYGVKISIENPEGILKPGMPADVVFEGAGDE